MNDKDQFSAINKNFARAVKIFEKEFTKEGNRVLEQMKEASRVFMESWHRKQLKRIKRGLRNG